jgi:3-hydroxymyristoyl/3-hydroxydecanoyl-(acyl carrier protein) dehydratase
MFIPDYEVVEHTHERLELTLKLQPEMPCFAGHFENLPVLPGVVQVGWVQTLAQRHFGKTFLHNGLRSVKFQQLVRPPVQLTLVVDWIADRGLLKFTYSNLRGRCSSGAISVTEGD